MACGRSTLVPATSQLLFSTHSCGLFRPSLAHPRQARFLHSSARRPPHTSSPTHTAQMSRASRTSRASPSTSLEEAQDLFKSSDRILALCGAGLSAASGLPTFRGSGGLWRNHDPIKLANAKAFRQDPALVWLFYAWRRHLALSAQPNGGHYALAELARKNKNFLCLTQNVDCLSTRAGHPASSLRQLHGSLFDIKCFDDYKCGYVEVGNFQDPLCPALEPASAVSAPAGEGLPLLNPDVPVPDIDIKDLPHCPSCEKELLRPGVVWFGDSLDADMLQEIEAWIDAAAIDLMIVVGTSGQVQPAASYVAKAKIGRGARVVLVNPDPDSAEDLGLGPEDFWFQDDAATILPQLIAKIANDEA